MCHQDPGRPNQIIRPALLSYERAFIIQNERTEVDSTGILNVRDVDLRCRQRLQKGGAACTTTSDRWRDGDHRNERPDEDRNHRTA